MTDSDRKGANSMFHKGNLPSPLTPEERAALAKLEDVVSRGIRAFATAGKALDAIRDKRLYRETHSAFESYVAAPWKNDPPARPSADRGGGGGREFVTSPLGPEERAALAKLEDVVSRGIRAFATAGKALATIRGKQLFRETHNDFESYVAAKWKNDPPARPPCNWFDRFLTVQVTRFGRWRVGSRIKAIKAAVPMTGPAWGRKPDAKN